MNKNNKGIFSFHTVTSQSINVNDDFFDEKEKIEIYDNVKKNKTKGEKIEFCSLNQENESKNNEQKLILNANKKKKICRICYLEEENKITNPLIKPCKCSGSMKYIHYECLLHWLRTKLIINKRQVLENGFFDIYKLETIKCELCNNHLLNYINHNNKLYSLIDYHRLDKQIDKLLSKKEKSQLKKENNYIILDDIIPGKNSFLCRYLVKFNTDNTLKIGRGLDNQLILNDISVSRNHSIIKLDQSNNLILEDNNSKFGTLVLVQAEEIEILKGKTLIIQSGTNYFSFKLEPPKKSFFSCCNAEEIDEKNNYEKINSTWVKLDKSSEIFNETISGIELNDEKIENKSNNLTNNDINNSEIKRQYEEKEELIEIEIEKNDNYNEQEKEDVLNLIKIGENQKDNLNTNNTNNFNNIDSAMNISTLKINSAVNISQIENIMAEIREENKSENEKNSSKMSVNKQNRNNNINIEEENKSLNINKKEENSKNDGYEEES